MYIYFTVGVTMLLMTQHQVDSQVPDCEDFLVEHGKVETLSVAARLITCHDGYIAKGNVAPVCLPFPDRYKWSTKPARCIENRCYHTERLEKGPRRVTAPTIVNPKFPKRLAGGAAITFTCERGFKLNQPIATMACLLDFTTEIASFSAPIPECIPTCETPSIANGTVTMSPDGMSATLKCDRNFALTGVAYLTCILRLGRYVWDLRPGSCYVNFCTGAAKMNSGRVRVTSGFDPDDYDVVKAGNSLGFACQAGFKLKGPRTITCVHNNYDGSNYFSSDPPKCIGCPKGIMRAPEHGWVTFTLDGSVATFACDPGFDLIGKSRIQCNDQGLWLGNRPKCEEP